MKKITVLRTSFKMLFNFKTLLFNSLWIVCLICFTVIVEKIFSVKSADNSLLMFLKSACFFSKKNFSVRIYILIKLLLLALFWSDLHKNKMWNDAYNLSVQSLLYYNNFYKFFLWKLFKAEINCLMNCCQFVYLICCSFFLSKS